MKVFISLLPVCLVTTALLFITDTYASDKTTSPTSSPTSLPTSSPASSPTSSPASSPTSSPASSPASSPTSSPASSPPSSPTSSPTSSDVTTGTTHLPPHPPNASTPLPNTTSPAINVTELTTASLELSTTQMPSATQSHSPGSATTELSHSITTSSSVSSNTNSTIPGPTKPCESKPCGGDASCVNLYSTYICLCTEGYYFNSGACLRGKTFPGLITVKGNDVSDLQNGGSLAYENFWNDTTTFFQSAFAKTDYKQTVIHTISTSSLQARFVSVMAKVVNIFEQNTTENETSVSAKINDTITNSNNILAYSGENRCDYYGCKDDPQDNCLSGSNCQCKDGLQRPFLQSPFCLETFQCPKDCNPENKKQCLKDSTGRVVCKCLPGYRKTDGDDACQECPFGYSGMNCEDKFQLILTIVGAVLGVLVLGLLIALVISVSSSNKKNIEEQNLIENDFQNLHLQHTAFSNPKTKGSLFPEVRTQPSRAHQGFNPYGDQ